MIESILAKSAPIPDEEAEKRDAIPAPDAAEVSRIKESDDSLVTALSVVQKIVRRKLLFSWQETAAPADLVHSIALRLLKWRDKYRQKAVEMTSEEWKSFAARTAYNEINRLHSRKNLAKIVSLDDAPEISSQESVEGNSKAEVSSLARFVWQEICELSLRQRQALLLHSHQMVNWLKTGGITDEELCRSLELSSGEWADLQTRLSLSNLEIASLLIEKSGRERGIVKDIESLIKSIKNSRYEARRRLQNLVKK